MPNQVIDSIEIGPEPIAPDALQIVSGDKLTELANYLSEQYTQADSEFEVRNQKLSTWRTNMEAIASNAPKNHPYKNSSNVVVPVTQTIDQGLTAKIMGMFARDPLWTVESQSKSDIIQKQAKTIEKYLDLLAKSPYDLNFQASLQDLIGETVLTGGAFSQVPYLIDSWPVRDSSGAETMVTWHDGPAVIVRPLEQVKYRRGKSEISQLPWIAVDNTLTDRDLDSRVAKGIYTQEDVDAVKTAPRTSPNTIESQRQVAELGDEAQTTELYDISEFYVYWDVDGTGDPVDLLITMHVPTKTILKQQYNSLGVRNIVNAQYIHRPGAMIGRGVGQLTESMNDEVTAVHNLRNDNMKLANTRMFLIKRGSAFGGKREIYPGAKWEVDDTERDVKTLQLGEVYNSSLSSEGNGWSIAQKASGLSDSQMGFSDTNLGTRDTFRGQAMRLQTGDSILGNVVEGLKNTISQIGMLVWMQIVANKDRVIARETIAGRLDADELVLLSNAMEMNIKDVPMKLHFTVKTTEISQTFEQRRTGLLQLTNLYTLYAEKTMPIALQLFGQQGQMMKQQAPEAWNYMARILTGSGKLMEQMFKFFGMYDATEYVPDPDKLDQILDMVSGMAQSFQGAPDMTQMGQLGQANQQQVAQPTALGNSGTPVPEADMGNLTLTGAQ